MTVVVPPDELLRDFDPIYRYFLHRLEFLQQSDQSLGFTSWYRTPERNRAVGGNSDSQHLFGFAVDLVSSRAEDVARLAQEIGLRPVLEFDHVHIQLFEPGLLRSLGFFGVEV